MPASAHALRLFATYTADAGSSPTRIVARPGARPVRSRNSATSRATSARTRAATSLPSMIVALMRSGTLKDRGALALCDRREIRDHLALGVILAEPDHDDPAGFEPGHDTFAEFRMGDVLAEPERRGRRLVRIPRRAGVAGALVPGRGAGA